MEPAPLIRQLNLADLDAFFQLRLRGLQAHPEAFGTSHQEALEKGPAQYRAILQGTQAADGNFVLGAFNTPDLGLIGTVGLRREPRLKERHKAVVVGMYVAPEAAGHGVGRALLKDLLARSERIEGLRQIQLVVTKQNEAARHLYESLGFRCYGREVDALCIGGAFHDADLMARFI
jgi:RimJ/RimL family protein N-acetyltransferase